MRALPPIAVILLVACKEGGGTVLGPVVYDLEGTWSIAETLTDSLLDIACVYDGTIVVTQTGTAFSGTVTETGTCTHAGESRDDSGTFSVTGTVTGLTLTMTASGLSIPCTYSGTLSGSVRGSPPTRMAGTARCTGTVDSVAYDYRGDWEASR